MFADDIPIHRRPGYNEKNFPGHNALSAAQSADQWAATGPGYQQTYEGVDHDRNSIVAQTMFHGEEPGALGDLDPHQVMGGYGFDIDPRSVVKVDPAASPPGAFSRGVHPNWDPANQASRESDPPPTAEKGAQAPGWIEKSPQGDAYRNVGYGTVWVGKDPYSIDSNIHARPPLSSGQFG